MNRVVAIIDGEHYPPVVRFALQELSATCEVVGAAFIGGTEKVDLDAGPATYGVPLIAGSDAQDVLREAIRLFSPDEMVDLSDEPVVSASDRFRLAGVALSAGVAYRGADFRFDPPRARVTLNTPTVQIIGTGKRVGKTSVSAFAARTLAAAGHDVVVLAMGRGGPAEPELIRGDQVALTTPDLLALAALGRHASSDNYEDAVMARVTTVGCRRCGGGLAGETFFSNVVKGALLADSLGKELVVLEGSGAAIPPVHADATMLVVGAGRGIEYVAEFFGPYRVGRADLIVLAGAEEPIASAADLESLREVLASIAPDTPVIETVFRPEPLESVEGRRIFFATTAPLVVMPALVEHLESVHGCEVVAASANLSDRTALRADIAAHAGRFDMMLTELKAAAIDVVAMAGEAAGVPTVLCDNVPVVVRGGALDSAVTSLAQLALKRAAGSRERDRQGA